MIETSATRTAICPRCGHAMKLARTVPKLGGLPELLVFRCPACNEVQTKENAAGGMTAGFDIAESTVG